jgi:hypothetical protein
MASLVDQIHALAAAWRAAGIPFAFGGALALAYAVEEPRGTRDIDVNLFLPIDQADEVFAALPAGVDWTADDLAVVRRDGQVRVFWDDTPLDLFFATDPFHESAARRVREVPLTVGHIPVLDANDLAVFKAFFDRTKDWADLETMVDAGSIDADDALGWLERLLGPDDSRTQRLEALLDAGRRG